MTSFADTFLTIFLVSSELGHGARGCCIRLCSRRQPSGRTLDNCRPRICRGKFGWTSRNLLLGFWGVFCGCCLALCFSWASIPISMCHDGGSLPSGWRSSGIGKIYSPCPSSSDAWICQWTGYVKINLVAFNSKIKRVVMY
jgi:hypothetical protein